MASVLAIVSKALFDKMVPKDVALGAVVDTDRYRSSNKAFDGLSKGDAIFLVTVRPPSEKLWLVGILDRPTKKGADWVSAANATPLADITAAIKKLTFESGTGIKAKKGALGMSLQTPRELTANDVALIRGMVPKAAAGKKVAASAAYRKAVTAGRAKPVAAKKQGAGFRLENARQPFKGTLADLQAFEKKQLAKVVGDVAKAFAGGIEEDMANAWIVDVVDAKSGTTTYQLHLFGFGDGYVFTNQSTKVAGSLAEHGFDRELPAPDKRALETAWKRDAKRLKLWQGHIDFDSERDDED